MAGPGPAGQLPMQRLRAATIGGLLFAHRERTTSQRRSQEHVRVSAAQAFGGENDQCESTCDHRTARRWHFAGSGAKWPCNWRRTAGSRRRGRQSCCTKRAVCLRDYNEQVGSQEDVEIPEEVIQADVKPEFGLPCPLPLGVVAALALGSGAAPIDFYMRDLRCRTRSELRNEGDERKP